MAPVVLVVLLCSCLYRIYEWLALDSFAKSGTMDIYREPNGSNTKDGSYYSLKMSPTVAGTNVYWPTYYDEPSHFSRFAGKDVVFGCWIKTSTASHAFVRLADGVSDTDSSYQTGFLLDDSRLFYAVPWRPRLADRRPAG